MPWQLDSSMRTRLALASDPDDKRQTPEARARQRDMRMLEELRKLRRDRAEAAMRQARQEATEAAARVLLERGTVVSKRRVYDAAQAEVTAALNTGRQSLDDVRKLLRQVDVARDGAHEAQTAVSALMRRQVQAETHADEEMQRTRVAAAAHEKVLEWKKSA